MLTRTLRALTGASLLLFVLASNAFAGPANPLHYLVTGSVDGSFTGTIDLTPASDAGSYTVKAHEVRGSATLDWTGTAKVGPKTVITIERKDNAPGVGFTGALAGDSSPVSVIGHEYVAVFPDENLTRGQVKVYTIDSASKRTEVGSATYETSKEIWEKGPGDILALAQKTLDSAVHKELDLNKDFSVASFLNVGVKVGAQLLAAGDRTADMQESDRLFRAAGKGEPIWIRTTIEGGPTVSWSKGIPIDPAAALNLDFGFSAGARVRYLCEDQYRRPDGVTDDAGILDVIEAVPSETFALPMSSDLALQQPAGAHRLINGNGSLAISGGVSVGARLEQLGILGGHANIDLAAGINVHWSIGGNLQLEVTREQAQKVRVHWMRASATDFGAGASLVIGLTVDQAASDAAKQLVTNDTSAPSSVAGSVVTAIINQGTNYTQVKFSFSADWQSSNQLDVDMEFDLSNPQARPLFEKAVRGDIAAAQDLGAKGPAAGVLQCKVTSTLTDALATDTQFSVFSLLSYHDAERTAAVRVDVKTQDGTHAVTDMHEFSDDTNHLFNGEDHLSVVASNRTVEKAPAPPVQGERVDIQTRHVDDSTNSGDVRADLKTAQLLLGDVASADVARLTPDKDYDYSKTELDLTISLGDAALKRILAVDQNAFYAAYAKTFTDKNYTWTPERVQYLGTVNLSGSNNGKNGSGVSPDHDEAWALREAKDSFDYLKKAKKTTDLSKQLQAFPDMAEDDGYKFHAVVALALVAGGVGAGDVQVKVSLSGKYINFSHEAGSVTPLPNQP